MCYINRKHYLHVLDELCLLFRLLHLRVLLEFLKQLSDLSPIKHIWDVIGGEVRRKDTRNLRQLEVMGQNNTVTWLLCAVVARLSFMIRADGSHTKY